MNEEQISEAILEAGCEKLRRIYGNAAVQKLVSYPSGTIGLGPARLNAISVRTDGGSRATFFVDSY